jgi:hypothetical protein
MGVSTETKIELSFSIIACAIYAAIIAIAYIKRPNVFDFYAKLILALNLLYLFLVAIYPVEAFNKELKLALIPLQHLSMQL